MQIFNRLKALIIAQGIIAHIVILPETDLIEDLEYQPSDVAELLRMIQREFRINVAPEASTGLSRLNQITDLIAAHQLLSAPRKHILKQ